MGIGQEIKDFVSGFQAGYKMVADAEYDKARLKIADRQMELQERQMALEEQNQPLKNEYMRAQIDQMGANTDLQRWINEDPENRRFQPREPSADERSRDEFEMRNRWDEEQNGVVRTSFTSAGMDSPVRGEFMDVVAQRISNPYGLAAVDMTGTRESGWSAGNLNRQWDDLGAPAGGAMSWRGPRLQAMKAHAGSDSAAGQAAFFLQENPDLIDALNNARSIDEAVAAINRKWAFKGYNDPNHPETRARYDTARQIYQKRYARGIDEVA